MGELLSNSQRIRVVHISTLFVYLFVYKVYYAQTILKQVREGKLDIHKNIFHVEGVMTE